ncbi:hypothetical protein UFOVP1292_51 [uncultured Caudovirales phage]|uniref:Gene product 88 domain-containing protein n=1 Tax=uncultured Caudovirales phage TaxID=2100421 RepID=A0A6J5RQ89_9CAUD|nr:hypothetical protein UFOVP859_44 [uncultured Caudovirales phage]CAB4168509.1 hypothetical protein UFOVP882_42 [uncultured Caudovirales phage]CAB4196447.1 hypothetical protein UFOVP1292_51 [uncultured Caudovirales phage]CAB4205208.1 hypothetical protein UFOVP1411_42 [uncultured Caudovirales phage]
MNVSQAKEIAGPLSFPGKMPGTSYAHSATACITGSKLALIPGTPCHSCYAINLQKLRPSVDKGWEANTAKWNKAVELGLVDKWVEALVYQIIRYNTDGYHRWFVSGDLQSLQHLEAIVAICDATPHVKHWLPTQERSIVAAYRRKHNYWPDNLVLRVSASKLNGHSAAGELQSSVFTKDGGVPAGASECEAHLRDNKCGPCRACWDSKVHHIAYPLHK